MNGPEMGSPMGCWGIEGSALGLSDLVGRGFDFFFLEKQLNIIKL